MKPENIKIVLGYIMVCLIWGSTWFAIKLSVGSFTPLASAGFRFIVSALLFFILIKVKRIEIVKDKIAVKLYIMLGFCSFVLPFGLLYWAEQRIPSGLTSILFAVLPISVLIISRVMLPENKITPLQSFGILLGFLGIVLIFSKKLDINLGNDLAGMLAVLGAGIIQAFITVIMKKYSSHLNPVSLNFFPTLIAGPVLLLLGLAFEDYHKWVFDAQGILSVLYLAFFGTIIGFSTYYWLMHKIDIVPISLTSIITPIVAIIIGSVILNEKFTFRDFVGSSVVLIGILFANFDAIKNYLRRKRSNFRYD